jgi:hypothetical protein
VPMDVFAVGSFGFLWVLAGADRLALIWPE